MDHAIHPLWVITVTIISTAMSIEKQIVSVFIVLFPLLSFAASLYLRSGTGRKSIFTFSLCGGGYEKAGAAAPALPFRSFPSLSGSPVHLSFFIPVSIILAAKRNTAVNSASIPHAASICSTLYS